MQSGATITLSALKEKLGEVGLREQGGKNFLFSRNNDMSKRLAFIFVLYVVLPLCLYYGVAEFESGL